MKQLKNDNRIFSSYAKQLMVLVLSASDLIGLSLSWVFAVLFRFLIIGVFPLIPYMDILPLFVAVFFIALATYGLYPAVTMPKVEELKRLSIAISLTYLFLLGDLFFLRSSTVFSRLSIGISWVLALFFVPIVRILVRKLFIKMNLWGIPIALVGKNSQVRLILSKMRVSPVRDLKPVVAFVESNQGLDDLDIPMYSISEMKEIISANGVNIALIAKSGVGAGKMGHYLEICETLFSRIIFVDPTVSDNLLWIAIRKLDGMVGLEINQELLNTDAQIIKWLVDKGSALLGLLLSAPIFGVIAAWIKLCSPGPVFYTQIRVGENGENFNMVKFRTMQVNADEVLEEYLKNDSALKREWDKYQKLENDPRVTKAGKFLREFSLDELPQLWNVLKGDMSLVGPRPFFPEQRELYGEAYRHYVRVRPGITGMWQISGRAGSEFKTRAYWDEYYVRNWSVWLDIYILAKTFLVVISREGAY